MQALGVGQSVGQTNLLSAVEVRGLTEPGRYPDGGGLYLEVGKGARRWLLRYQLHGRRRDMILGALTESNGLGAARQAARDARALIERGLDPIDARRRPAGVPTFAAHAAAVVADLAPGWRGKKTEAGWTRSLQTHAAKLGPLAVDKVTTHDVLAAVRPYWSAQPESGAKMRERIERVLDSARAAGFIVGSWENPARWKGHLAHMLPKRRKLSRGHFKALHYADAPAFMAALRPQQGMGAHALEWTILTAAREGMVIGAQWSEISGAVWTVPGERMKDGRDFHIPLTDAALAVLERVARDGRRGYVFRGSREGSHISNATMDAVLKRMGVPATPHGFRSTFRDWAGDCTDHPREVAEMCLAHVVGDAVERAYRRSDAAAKRRRLLSDWADFLAARAAVDKAAEDVGADEGAGPQLEGGQLAGRDEVPDGAGADVQGLGG